MQVAADKSYVGPRGRLLKLYSNCATIAYVTLKWWGCCYNFIATLFGYPENIQFTNGRASYALKKKKNGTRILLWLGSSSLLHRTEFIWLHIVYAVFTWQAGRLKLCDAPSNYVQLIQSLAAPTCWVDAALPQIHPIHSGEADANGAGSILKAKYGNEPDQNPTSN